eukprot:3392348-Pyramimonas_sp.AAC.1
MHPRTLAPERSRPSSQATTPIRVYFQQLNRISQDIKELQSQIRPTGKQDIFHVVNLKAAHSNGLCGDGNCERNHEYPTRKTTVTKAQHFWEFWGNFMGHAYMDELVPPGLDQQQHERFAKNYHGIPEKFYSKTGLTVITPDNADSFLKHLLANGITSVD